MNTTQGMPDKDILITVIVAHNCTVACIGRVVLGEVLGQCDVARRRYIYTVFIVLCTV